MHASKASALPEPLVRAPGTRQPQLPRSSPLASPPLAPLSFVPASAPAAAAAPPSTVAARPPVPPTRPPVPTDPAAPPVAVAPPAPTLASGPVAPPAPLPAAPEASGPPMMPPSSGAGWVQSPSMQSRPGAHSVSSWQLVRHERPAASHWNGSQLAATGTLQLALPPHFGVPVAEPLAQKPTPQVTVAPGSAHVVRLAPSQNPPQAPEPGHAGRPSRGAPVMAMHLPSEPAWSHDSHWSTQAVSQQSPSTQ